MQLLWKTVWRFLTRPKIELPYDLTIPLLSIHPEKTLIWKDTCTQMFILVLFRIAKTWRQHKCPLTDEWIKKMCCIYTMEYSVQFSRSVVSDSLQPHELQHARPPCPSPTPGVYSNSCPLSRWCHPAISSSVVPFSSCPQSLPASGSFPMSQLFASGGQNIGVSASTSVLPMNTQDWSPLGWTSWISLQSKGVSRVFCNTTVQKHQFFGTQLSSVQLSFSPTLSVQLSHPSCYKNLTPKSQWLNGVNNYFPFDGWGFYQKQHITNLWRKKRLCLGILYGQ